MAVDEAPGEYNAVDDGENASEKLAGEAGIKNFSSCSTKVFTGVSFVVGGAIIIITFSPLASRASKEDGKVESAKEESLLSKLSSTT
jgi:VIT1/CCC1 family predicted Fe2+/Mn2+ transporter